MNSLVLNDVTVLVFMALDWFLCSNDFVENEEYDLIETDKFAAPILAIM